MTKIDLELLYKRETGRYICCTEISATRKRGQWIYNVSNEEALSIFGLDGTIEIPDLEYIEWLEKRLLERESP